MRTRIVVLAGAVLLAFLPAAAAAATDGDDRRRHRVAPVTEVADDALAEALTDEDITAARYALERARSLFTPRVVERRYGDVAAPESREATLILRDLALRAHNLAPETRDDARRLLARPTDGLADPGETGYRFPADASRECRAHVCVHWVPTTADAPSLADADADGIPDWVETTGAELERVWRFEVGAYGYRAPKSDLSSDNNGGDGRLDVYLADTGADDLYGYCTTDDPNLRRFDVSAYCVVDDDFSRQQFGAAPLNSLRVTVAHEFFHAVQFAYDGSEDGWLMEGTAAWIEDEVFDSVNDNHRYLFGGPLTHPHRPLDAGVYEPWVFFRFMAEYFGTVAADRPGVVRRIWQYADAAPGGRDDYSLRAVRRVSADNDVPFRSLFADFGWIGSFAKGWYDEGAAYPQTPMTSSVILTRAAPGIGTRAVTLRHLTNRHIVFRPGQSLPADRRLRVSVNLPDLARGSEATVAVQRRDGAVRAFAVRLNAAGDGATTVGFSRTTVARVVLTLTNASTRMRCWRYTTPLSCAGEPLDDNLRFGYSARAIR
jgi:hypothetical protein